MTGYDFNALYGQADHSAGTMYPAGTYDAVVEDCTYGRSKDGTKGQWTVKFRTTTGEKAGASPVTTNITVSPENGRALGIMFRHLGAFGIPVPPNQPFWAMGWTEEYIAQFLKGKPAQITIAQDEYDGRPQMKIRDIRPARPGAPLDWPRTAPAQAQPQQGFGQPPAGYPAQQQGFAQPPAQPGFGQPQTFQQPPQMAQPAFPGQQSDPGMQAPPQQYQDGTAFPGQVVPAGYPQQPPAPQWGWDQAGYPQQPIAPPAQQQSPFPPPQPPAGYPAQPPAQPQPPWGQPAAPQQPQQAAPPAGYPQQQQPPAGQPTWGAQPQPPAQPGADAPPMPPWAQ
jgi:hypothetical protein